MPRGCVLRRERDRSQTIGIAGAASPTVSAARPVAASVQQ
jgi:hypothetical protein